MMITTNQLVPISDEPSKKAEETHVSPNQEESKKTRNLLRYIPDEYKKKAIEMCTLHAIDLTKHGNKGAAWIDICTSLNKMLEAEKNSGRFTTETIKTYVQTIVSDFKSDKSSGKEHQTPLEIAVESYINALESASKTEDTRDISINMMTPQLKSRKITAQEVSSNSPDGKSKKKETFLDLFKAQMMMSAEQEERKYKEAEKERKERLDREEKEKMEKLDREEKEKKERLDREEKEKKERLDREEKEKKERLDREEKEKKERLDREEKEKKESRERYEQDMIWRRDMQQSYNNQVLLLLSQQMIKNPENNPTKEKTKKRKKLTE